MVEIVCPTISAHKIAACISSCKTIYQFINCWRMIVHHQKRYSDKGYYDWLKSIFTHTVELVLDNTDELNTQIYLRGKDYE